MLLHPQLPSPRAEEELAAHRAEVTGDNRLLTYAPGCLASFEECFLVLFFSSSQENVANLFLFRLT